jgi:imidazolonepropionase-like amidohydrolase
MLPRSLSLFLGLAFFTGRALFAQTQRQETTVITHVTVIDVATGKELHDQTVVFSGERILSVAAFDSANVPLGRTTDAHGGFLIPGLLDMHVHIQDLEDLPLYIANGVTGVRLMFGSKHTPSLRAKIAGVAAAPEVIYGSAIVDGDPPVWEGSIVIKNPGDARRTVDEIKADGADFVKIYNYIPRDAYFALAEEAHKQDIPFAGHLPFGVRASEASDAGQRSIEHLDGIAIACSKKEENILKELHSVHYLEKMNLVAEALRSFDAARCQALFAQFRRNGTWQVPTLTVHRGMAYLNDGHFTTDPRLAYMNVDVRYRWHPENDFRFRRWTPGVFELHRGLFNADKQMVGLMSRAGVPLLAGTDAMNPFCFPGFSLHDELALMVESGLTPLAALQSATLRPAEFLGRAEEFGIIAAGKRADLVLLAADPLADIHNTTKIQAVWLHGKLYDRAALDTLLEAAKHRSGKGKLH